MVVMLGDLERHEILDEASQHKYNADVNGSWTTVLHVLIPLAALTLLWGNKGFITRFFLQFKENCVSALCPSLDKHPHLLKWVDDRLKYTRFSQLTALRSKASAYWKNGTLLCSLINSAIPGACSNPHKHWKDRPFHGQDLAYKYFGITPIFTEEDLTNGGLSAKKEYQFFDYLIEVEKSIEKALLREIKYTSHYVARGMGLMTGEQYKKSVFYIYNNYPTIPNENDVVVSISGPYGTHCSSTIPSRCDVKKQTELQSLAYVSRAQKLFFRSFSIDLGSIANTERKDDPKDDVPIKIITEKDRVRVIFIPQTVGVHEISIVTNGFHLVGSPFVANILPPSTDINESFDNEGEGCGYTGYYRIINKKIVSKIIDCIDEEITLFNTTSIPDHNPMDPNVVTQNLSVEKSVVQSSEETSNTYSVTEQFIHTQINADANAVHQDTLSIDFNPPHEILEEEMGLEENEILAPGVCGESRASPICKSHIEHEVISPFENKHLENRKTLKRQCEIEMDEDCFATTISNCQDMDLQLETILENEERVESAASTYTDSYLTELQLQSDLLFLNFDTHTQHGDYLHQVSLSKPTPKTRRSLPNVLSSVNQTTSLQSWKRLSSHTLSSSSLNSEQNYSSSTFYMQQYNNEAAKSLPNLSDLREADLNKTNLRYNFEADGSQTDSYRNKFLQCRNYWETLSKQHISASTEIISENDFDSGYYASLPNLSPNFENGNKMSKEFRERQQFWENISLDSSKWVQQQQQKKNALGTAFLQKVKMLTDREPAGITISENTKENIFNEEDEVNLTDDSKEICQLKFAQTRNFFKNLEKLGN